MGQTDRRQWKNRIRGPLFPSLFSGAAASQVPNLPTLLLPVPHCITSLSLQQTLGRLEAFPTMQG